jgi:hypothetical protein
MQYETTLLPILDQGVYTELQFEGRQPLSATVEMDLTGLAHGTTLYAFGRITYSDENETLRTTGFCRYWDMPQGTQIPRFYRMDDPDFEYED